MQIKNENVSSVIQSLNSSLNQLFGTRLLTNSHHLSTWLCSTYVAQFYRSNKNLSYNECFKRCYPIIEDICSSKDNGISKENLLKLVEEKISPTL